MCQSKELSITSELRAYTSIGILLYIFAPIPVNTATGEQ
jgi:hypothetical protein